MSVKVELNKDEIFTAILQYMKIKYPHLSPTKGEIHPETRYKNISATIECEYKK